MTPCQKNKTTITITREHTLAKEKNETTKRHTVQNWY